MRAFPTISLHPLQQAWPAAAVLALLLAEGVLKTWAAQASR